MARKMKKPDTSIAIHEKLVNCIWQKSEAFVLQLYDDATRRKKPVVKPYESLLKTFDLKLEEVTRERIEKAGKDVKERLLAKAAEDESLRKRQAQIVETLLNGMAQKDNPGTAAPYLLTNLNWIRDQGVNPRDITSEMSWDILKRSRDLPCRKEPSHKAPKIAPAATETPKAEIPKKPAATSQNAIKTTGKVIDRALAVLTATPKKMKQIVKEAGLADTCYNSLQVLVNDGKVIKTKDGFSLPKKK